MQDTFGKYRLVQRLAFGGMAEVFLARVQGEAGFSKTVVIKRLHPRLSEDHEFTRMLIDEARITSQLAHSNICQVLDLGQVDGSYFIAMEHVPGEDLRTVQDFYRRQRLHMPVQVAAYIVTELLAGLDFAHRREDAEGHTLGVIHRDISPQNLLISYEGEVKVIDFGIAKARQRLVQTQAGVIKGKFRYMSPEQATGGKVDQRTDLFAAGVVLYELLRGEPHSLSVPDTEVLRRMRDAEFDPVDRDPSEVPPALLKLLARALHKSPRKRFQTASAFRQELLQLMPKLPPVFADRASPFGRDELAVLMKQIFPAERRNKRSGKTSQRSHGAADSSLPPRQANHATGGLPVGESAEDAAAAEAALVEASGRLPRDTTDQLVDDRAERRAHKAEAGPSRSRGESRAVAELATRVGEPSSAALADDAEGHSGRRRSGRSSRASATGAEERAQQSGTARPRRRTDTAGAFSRSAPPVADSRKRSGHTQWEDADFDDEAPSYPPPRQPRRRAPSRAVDPDATRIEAQAAEPRRPPRSGSGLRWLVALIVLAGLGAAAFYVGRHGLPDWVPLPAKQAPIDELIPESEMYVDDPVPAPEPEVLPSKQGRRYGQVRIESEPSGATVRICGKRAPRPTPVTVRIRRGRRCQLRLQLDGYEPYSARVRVPGRRGLTVNAKLQRGAQPAVSDSRRDDKGALVVTSIRVGSVFINGQNVGQTPRLELSLPPGQYAVWMRFTGLGTQTGTRTIYIKPGQRQKLHFTPTM